LYTVAKTIDLKGLKGLKGLNICRMLSTKVCDYDFPNEVNLTNVIIHENGAIYAIDDKFNIFKKTKNKIKIVKPALSKWEEQDLEPVKITSLFGRLYCLFENTLCQYDCKKNILLPHTIGELQNIKLHMSCITADKRYLYVYNAAALSYIIKVDVIKHTTTILHLKFEKDETYSNPYILEDGDSEGNEGWGVQAMCVDETDFYFYNPISQRILKASKEDLVVRKLATCDNNCPIPEHFIYPCIPSFLPTICIYEIHGRKFLLKPHSCTGIELFNLQNGLAIECTLLDQKIRELPAKLRCITSLHGDIYVGLSNGNIYKLEDIWKYSKYLWLGYLKEDNCIFKKLPKDIVKEIIKFIK
jgi:hypothetical protein